MSPRSGRLCASLFFAGTLAAHHSLANFDTSTAVRVKGKIVQFNQINPHSFLYIEEKLADRNIRRWAVEGPSVIQLKRSGAGSLIQIGDEVEVCGYAPKEVTMWQIANPDSASASLSGRLLNAELLILADGKERPWGDYGFHKCFSPGYTDQHSLR